MKKIINIFCIALLLPIFTSCGNAWLDVESSTNIESEGALNNLKQFEFVMNGIYSLMQDSDGFTGRLVYYGDVTADDIQAYSSTKRTGKYYLMSSEASTITSSFWKVPYEIIRNCNIVLTEIDAIKTEDNLTDYKNDIKGQALMIKSLCYFELTRVFGKTYTMDNGASLGAALVNDVLGISAKPERSTVAKCYEQIIKDLNESSKLLAPDFVKGKVNKWAALGLLSRVYLYKGDNENALKTAEEAIEGAEDNGYRLWTNEEYPTAWGWDVSEGSSQGEVLFEIVNITTDGPGKESMGYLCSTKGYNDMILTSSFYALMNEDPGDVRNKAYKLYSYRAYINKYQQQEGENYSDANITLIRLSELYLNAAEAAVKSGNNADAVKYLEPIVNRANPNKTVVGTTVTLEKVLTERRKELFGEGHRAYDIHRNNLRVERKDIPNSKIKYTKHLSQSSDSKSFDRTFYKTILPIPKFEIDANSNIQQNPEY